MARLWTILGRIVAFGLAFVAGFVGIGGILIFALAAPAEKRASRALRAENPTVEVVAIKTDLPAGHALTWEDLTLVELPEALAVGLPRERRAWRLVGRLLAARTWRHTALAEHRLWHPSRTEACALSRERSAFLTTACEGRGGLITRPDGLGWRCADDGKRPEEAP